MPFYDFQSTTAFRVIWADTVEMIMQCNKEYSLLEQKYIKGALQLSSCILWGDIDASDTETSKRVPWSYSSLRWNQVILHINGQILYRVNHIILATGYCCNCTGKTLIGKSATAAIPTADTRLQRKTHQSIERNKVNESATFCSLSRFIL